MLPPPDPRSLCPLSSTEFVDPPARKNSWVRHCPYVTATLQEPDIYNSCDFIFRTPSYYVIVKTYGDILITSLVSAPALLPIHCISLELVNSSLVRFISAHAALIGTANLAVLATVFVYSFHYDVCYVSQVSLPRYWTSYERQLVRFSSTAYLNTMEHS